MSCLSRKSLFTLAVGAAVGVGVAVGSRVAAEPAKEAKAAGAAEPKLPPGWTAADVQACVLASTPGKMHEQLARDAGQWQGTTTLWMAPGADPMTGDCTSTVTPIMGGRFTKTEMAGDMPGMGPYAGLGIAGFDNVSQRFVSTWVDNQGTGMMTGTGERSADGKTITWTFTFNCPLTKKPMVSREVDTVTGPDTKTLEMFNTDPKSGKEFRMMRLELKKKP